MAALTMRMTTPAFWDLRRYNRLFGGELRDVLHFSTAAAGIRRNARKYLLSILNKVFSLDLHNLKNSKQFVKI
jgi:hypothetical protein